ncbi:MAG: peptidoglycan-binding domain-containing protein [Patescibacteria group bacterium]
MKQNFLLKLTICAAAVLIIIGFKTNNVFASATTGTIDSVYKYAWSENIGWINFGTASSAVSVTDAGLDGYAWSGNYGWINLNATTSRVGNNSEGSLSGYAWGEQTGWIDFSGVSINYAGEFSGYATGTVTGQISFNCSNTSSCSSSDFKVKTDWRPLSVRNSACGDGVDNDSDGLTDYPADSGCSSATDNDETNVSSGGGGGGGGGGGAVVIPPPVIKTSTSTIATSTVGSATSTNQNQYIFSTSSLPQSPIYAGFKFTKGLAYGLTGEDVKKLQEILSQYPEIYPEGLITGFFGLKTEKAVMKFQIKYNIAKKGVPGFGTVGPNTRIKLNQILSGSQISPSSTVAVDNQNKTIQELKAIIQTLQQQLIMLLNELMKKLQQQARP